MINWKALLILSLAMPASPGQCLQQPDTQKSSASTPPRSQVAHHIRHFAKERETLMDLGAANNRAMAAGDVMETMRIVAPAYVLVLSSGQIVRSSSQMRAIWIESLHDKKRLCVRTPHWIKVGNYRDALRAAESGEWTCRSSATDASEYGSYFANWVKVSGVWKVISDNYVGLGCRGAGCKLLR